MTAYTPGPRIVENGKDDGVSFCIVLGAGHEFVATFENRADALLDAAAPDLLAVLEAILHPDNEAIVYFVPSDSYAMKLRDQARAAIAAAKGET